MTEKSLKDPFGDPQELAAALAREVRGEVRFDEGSRALYSTDASNYRQIPIGVVLPRDREDVVKTVELCRKYDAPLLPRGGGTSLAGQCCNVAVVLDMSKYMNRILEMDPEKRRARVEPGLVLDDLRRAAREYGLTFGPDPATHNRCTLGGMIGNNSCGIHSVMAGRTVDNIEELEVLTYDGLRLTLKKTDDREYEQILREGGRRAEIYRALHGLRDRYGDRIREKFPDIPRRVSGFSIDQLLPENGFHVARSVVGSEGTCVLVLSAVVRLVPEPRKKAMLVLGYKDIAAAGDHVPDVLEAGPVGLEGLDEFLIHYEKKKKMHPSGVKLLPDGDGWLIAEFGGDTREEALEKARKLEKRIREKEKDVDSVLLDRDEDMSFVWEVRESGLGATAFVKGQPDSWPGWEDSAVPPDKMGAYLRDLRKLMDRYGYKGSFYGHFGDGCLHTRISFDLYSEEGIAKYRSFVAEAADIVVGYGGSLSGEHGDGQARGELLVKMFGPELIEAFREFKSIWDPAGRMNPGKVVEPYGITENLRMRIFNRRGPVETWFKYPDDEKDFNRAALRCVGVGKCRRQEGGVMCPSYMVTREEKHSTRGRARLLYEMLEGGALSGGWKNEEVKDALDLCLACKGCKGDCPVQVDMATYKAEFLAHYYEGRPRPVHAYVMGWIHRWSRLASLAPALANFFMQTPGLSGLIKKMSGIAPERQMPRYAAKTFRSLFREEKDAGPREEVILWTDTFNNHFYPEVLMSGVEVLRELGFRVRLPGTGLCCGRPLYDYGMLKQAKRQLEVILDALAGDIEKGTPVIGLEPSCTAVFRDELLNLFPDDIRAKKLSSQVFTFGEFLEKHSDRLPSVKWEKKAIIQGHCHHKAVMRMQDDLKVMKKTGLEFELLDSGCCGMAGAFGFEKDHYGISVQCAERSLLPRIREVRPEDAFIVADGFSCREQIRQLSGHKPLHLSQIFSRALKKSR